LFEKKHQDRDFAVLMFFTTSFVAFDNYLEGVTFSPNSLFLLVHSGDAVGQLFLITLEDGSQRLLQIPGVPLADRIGQVS